MRVRCLIAGISLALMASAAGAADVASAALKPFRAPLARPTDPAARPTGRTGPTRNSYTVPEAPSSPACTRNFCVHWVAVGVDAPDLADRDGNADGDGVPDFVERVQGIAEHVYSIENRKLGWREPKSDGRRGGGRGKTDIYLGEANGKLFGYAAPDRNQAGQGRLPRRLYGYLVLDNDYDSREFPGTKPDDVLKVTIAHEYNHILQFGYDAYQDAWLAESTAVWMEDQVYDGIDDYVRYVRRWVRRYATPLTAKAVKIYGSAVWNQWVAHRYGRAIVRRIWARAIRSKPGGFSVATYDGAIKAAGGSGFSQDFARFARDTAEWRTAAIFPEARGFPDVSRQGRLPVTGRPLTRFLNHTTFQSLRVRARGGRAVVVGALAPRGIAAGLALVGRIGSERRGRVVARLRFKRRGGRMVVRLARPGRFSRLTAVLVNADARAVGFSTRRLDWNYLTDTAPFELRARVLR